MTKPEQEISFEAAKAIALRSLNLAPRTKHQLRLKLSQRGVPENTVEQVLERLVEINLVDDLAYAQMFIRSKIASRGLAPLVLRKELAQKGVPAELIELALGELDPEATREIALGQAQKKLRSLQGVDEQIQTRRIASFLARKGYPSNLIWSVIRELSLDSGSL